MTMGRAHCANYARSLNSWFEHFGAFCFKEFSFFIVDFPFHVRWKETDEEIWSKAISGLSEIGPQPSSRTPCANTLRASIYNQHLFTLWGCYCFKYDKSRGPSIRVIHCLYIILWSKNSYQKEFIWEIAFKNDYHPDHHHHHFHVRQCWQYEGRRRRMALISMHPSSARQKNLETHILSHFDSTMST